MQKNYFFCNRIAITKDLFAKNSIFLDNSSPVKVSYSDTIVHNSARQIKL